MNVINLAARLARLEARRREIVPDRQRLAEASARLVAAVDGMHDLDEILAFRAELLRAGRASRDKRRR